MVPPGWRQHLYSYGRLTKEVGRQLISRFDVIQPMSGEIPGVFGDQRVRGTAGGGEHRQLYLGIPLKQAATSAAFIENTG